MKRLLAMLIVFALVLSGCAQSGEQSAGTTTTTQAVPEREAMLADCGTEAGMISHKSTTKYSFFESDGVVSTRNMLFVPAGTTLSSECRMAVYTYNEKNTLDLERLSATGQQIMNTYLVVMSEGTVTLEEDTFLRVSVSGSLEDVTVTYPSGKASEAYVFDNDYEAYNKDYDRILSELKTTDDGAVNYIFITDIHYDKDQLTNVQVASLNKQVELIVKMANESDEIDFVVIGGDTTSGCSSKQTKTDKYVGEILDPLRSCEKPVFVLKGNHDDNSYFTGKTVYSQDMADSLVSRAEWNETVLKEFAASGIVHDSRDENSAYYYYDIPEKKIRAVCLDAADYPQQVNEENNIIASLMELNEEGNSKSGRSYWGYSPRQLQWLVNEALTAEDGWNYVFLSHMRVNAENYGAELKELLTAFQNRTAYSNDEVGSADFTTATGKILVYHYGHSHGSAVTEDESMKLWQILTSTANIAQLSGNTPSSDSYRSFGTDTECCFDVISATTEKIQKYGFGSEKDATLTVK